MGRLQINIFRLSILYLSLFSCTKLDLQWNLKKMPNVGNIEIEFNSTSEFQLKAECLSIGNDKNVQIGFCWAGTSNPTIDDSVFIMEQSNIGEFSLLKNWSDLSTYHFRAFVKNEIGIAYSQNQTISWPGNNAPPQVQTLLVDQVGFFSFRVHSVILNSAGNPILQRGVYIYDQINSTAPLQTFISNQSSNEFIINTTNLTDGQTYFVKAFATTLAGTGLGNAITVSLPKKYSIGDTGPAGGAIIYENPEPFQSWNYIEVAPSDVSVNSFPWSPFSVATNVTNVELGQGLQNTNAIIAQILNHTNYAAYLAKNWTFGGFSDWHLPSLKELLLIKELLFDVGQDNFQSGQIYWTSSEDAVYSTNAWTVKMQQINVNTILTYPKSELFKIRAIRKF